MKRKQYAVSEVKCRLSAAHLFRTVKKAAPQFNLESSLISSAASLIVPTEWALMQSPLSQELSLVLPLLHSQKSPLYSRRNFTGKESGQWNRWRDGPSCEHRVSFRELLQTEACAWREALWHVWARRDLCWPQSTPFQQEGPADSKGQSGWWQSKAQHTEVTQSGQWNKLNETSNSKWT